MIDPNANPGTEKPGLFGSGGLSGFDFNPQLFKTPHLRNAYQKIGMFGNVENPGFLGGDNGFKGDQVRGFSFLHDGNVDTEAIAGEAFEDCGQPGLAGGGPVSRQVELRVSWA